MKTKLLFVLLLFCLISIPAISQIDNEFWFAAPDVISAHGNSPVYLRVSAFDDDAEVTIDQPANPNFLPRTFKVNANTSYSYDLSFDLPAIATAPANTILNKALHIVSTSKVAAYYDVANHLNAEIFTLKGRNALGTEFYTPFQSDFNNGTNIFNNPPPNSSFDILATEDNTEVTINPAKDIVGHKAGISFKIVLNKGQTYSACAVSDQGSGHLMGSHITSNRPIAITIKDDSVSASTCLDLIGDQMVPISLAGTEYIAVKGFLESNVADRLYILATQNNTEVYLGGNTSPTTTLNAGQQYAGKLISASTYITSNNPVYVYHVSGFGCELGSAILPQIKCTGSTDMAFTRSTNEYFGLILLTQKGNENSFKLNGDSTLIKASSFLAVPGTNGKWVAASLDFTATVPVGVATRISNSSGSFNIGIINGGGQTSGKYGYFSDFSSLNIGNDRIVCDGDTVKLDAGKKAVSYLWSTGDTTQTIKVSKQNNYSVAVVRNNCLLKDTMFLRVNPKPNLFLGKDTNICAGNSIKLDAGANYFQYLWQNHSTASTLTTDTTGKYWARVVDHNNCVNSDTIEVTRREYPKIQLKDTVFCGTKSGNIKARMDQKGTGLWSSQSADITITPPNGLSSLLWTSTNGTFPIFFKGISEFGCAVKDTIQVGFYPKPTSSFSMDSSKCYGDNVNVIYTGTASNQADYRWNFDNCVVLSGEKQGPITLALGSIHEDKKLVLKVFENGCLSDSTLKILKVTPNFNLSSDTTAGCEPVTIKFKAQSNKVGVRYSWDFGDQQESTEQNPIHTFQFPQKYTVNLIITAPNGCQNAVSMKDMITVNQIPTSDISLDPTICYPDTISLNYLGNATKLATYNWDMGDIQIISGAKQGPFLIDISKSKLLNVKLIVEENGCTGTTTQVPLKRNPHLQLLTDVNYGCQPLLVHFDEMSKENGMSYLWNFGDQANNTSSDVKTYHLYSNSGHFDIGLTITSQQGCVNSQTFAGKITVNKKPTADFSLTPQVTMIDNPTVQFEDLSKSAAGFLWNFGDSTTSKEKDPKHVYTEIGTFNVRMIAISENQCTDTAFRAVSIGSFFAPTAFAPTSPVEKNRIFLPVGAGMQLQDFSMYVYNRWGNKIFESHDTNQGWDGKINGSDDAPAGGYAWVISYLNITGDIKKYSGTIILIR